MGVVYRAQDNQLGRIVALKFLPPFMSKDEEAKTRFVAEAKSASALDHPNICTIYEIGETETGELFIAMAYYDGETLHKQIRKGRALVDQAIEYTAQIARGLGQAHARGIIHRDIKPANVIVTAEGIAKIVDFGLVKSDDNHDLTQTGRILGTVAYMSPEQARGETIDQRTDVWSLGVVLYEMLAGRRPFKAKTVTGILGKIISESPAPFGDFCDEPIPVELEQIVARCLEKKKALRYPSMLELLADLDGLMQNTMGVSRSLTAIRMSQSFAPIVESGITIVVLPFVDMSPEKDHEYFSDGMAEELSDALAQIDQWRVVARTSAFSFKGKTLDVRQIGNQLGASHVLEGSIRKAGDNLRIRVELVDVESGLLIWSEKYHREIDDFFAIQEEIANSIVESLKVKLSPIQEVGLAKRHTNNLEAFQMYLKARFHLNQRSESGLQKAKAYCECALELDPDYAPAFACLADCLLLLGFQGADYPQKVMPLAKTAAERALELNETLVEAHTSLGCIRSVFDWDWTGAERAFRSAISHNTNYATAHHWYAIWYLLPMGQFDEAMAELKTAQQLDPISLVVNVGIAWCHYFAREFDLAIESAVKTLDIDEGFVVAHDLLGQAYLEKGMIKEAIAHMKTAVKNSNSRTLSVATLGHVYAVAGKRNDANKVIDHLTRRSKRKYVSSYDIALVHAGLGDRDQAFEKLNDAFEEHSGWLCFLNVEPRFEPLRNDVRFDALLKRVGFK